MPDNPTPSQRRAPTLPLIGGNVLRLYDYPLQLYPRAEFTLTVVVEQEPLKLFDTFAMTTEFQRAQLREEAGIRPESLLPYIVQMHGLFNLLDAVDDANHRYEPFYHYGKPNNNNGGPSQPTWWYGRPAFRPVVTGYVSGIERFQVTVLDYPLLPVVTFRGSPSATSQPTWNDHPIEAVYGYSPAPAEYVPVDGSGRPGQRFYVQQILPGDGTWRGSVTIDGHGRMTVQVTSMSRDIELRFGVTQETVQLPGHWGTNTQTIVEDWQIAPDDPGVWFRLATYKNNIAFGGQSMGPDMASLYGKSLETARGLSLRQYKASTMYQGGSEAVDGNHLDWTQLGNATESADLHYLKYMIFERTDVGSSSETERFWEVSSPLLVGIDKTPQPGLPGAFCFGVTGQYGDIDSVPSTDPPYTNAEAKKLFSDAKARRAAGMLSVFQQPRIKITMTMEVDEGADGVIEHSTTGYAYFDLPFQWLGHVGQTVWEDVVTEPDPSVFVWDDGAAVHTITERQTEDWRARGEIRGGSCHFTVLGSRDGVFIAETPQDGDTLGPLYPGPDSYLYRYDDPVNRRHYASWQAGL